jgi:hypothetical protein
MPEKKATEAPIYFTMNMPDWFIDLDDEEKMSLVKKMTEKSSSDHILTDDELLALMPEATS